MHIKKIWESIRWGVSGTVLGIGIALCIITFNDDVRMPFSNSVSEADYGKQFQSIIKGLRENNANQEGMPTEEEMLRIAIDAILEKLGDKHGNYFNPEDLERFTEGLNPSDYTGVGIVITPSSKGALILQIFDDSLLRFAGAREGDHIYAAGNPGEDFVVFGETEEGNNLQDLVDVMLGPEGTDVNLKIKRSTTDLGIITVQRVETRDQHVFMKLNDNGILNIRITHFSKNIVVDIIAWLDDKGLLNQDDTLDESVKAVVMDLRFNPGGYLNAAVALSDLFLEKELMIVTVVDSEGVTPFDSKHDPLFPSEMPKVFLINGTSASASEIGAGAVQHHEVAFLFGQDSFGKGSVQTTFSLPGGGAFKTTTAEWLVAGVVVIDQIGLTPNVLVPQPPSPGINSDWEKLNRHLIRISMDPEIDHQLHAAHEFLMRFVDGRFSLDSEPSVKASKELVQETKTIITKALCEEKGLLGCPTPSRWNYGGPRGSHGWVP